MNDLSIIVPMYNEEGNVRPLYEEITHHSKLLMKEKIIGNYEIIFVDDGSRDGTPKIMESIARKDKHFHSIQFRRNFGQTAALKAGFAMAKGDMLITMDGDMQSDPSDMKKLIEVLNKGYDVVSGWRYDRQDILGKRLASRIMNSLRRRLIGDRLHDYGCALKIYRKECVKDLQLFGELHRFITAYLYIKGYRIGEVILHHRPRFSGKTKYHFSRGINGLLDLLYLKFWSTFSDRPLHFFGRLGLYQWLLAFLIGIEQIIKSLIVGALNFGPLLALASLLVITGLLFIIFGFLSEMIARIYFKEENIYSIKRVL